MYHSIRFIDNLPLYVLIATRDMTIKMGKINFKKFNNHILLLL